MSENEKYIAKTYALAKSAVAGGNHPFGALLVYRGEVIATAENTATTEQDCTCHAEVNLVRKIQKLLDEPARASSVLYTSTEPCALVQSTGLE